MMHRWGDGFDFDRLTEAGCFISQYVFDKTKCMLSWKEKYGTIRYEYLFADADTLSFKAARLVDRITNSRWHVAEGLGCRIMNKASIHLRDGVMLAVDKYPDMADEILEDFVACYEHLVSKELHDKYWTSY